MKRINQLFVTGLLALTFAAGPLASTALASPTAPPALELVMNATPLAAATTTVEAPEVEAPPVTSWNPSDWFADAAILGGVIAALVALLKTNFLKSLHGLGTLALSFGLGIALSLLGTVNWPVLGRPNELTGAAAIMFGINAAVFASGGWDFIKGVLLAALGGKSRGAAEAST